MGPIPNPLWKRLVLTFLVGAGCFFVGLTFYFYEQDAIFFGLSSFVFAGSCIKCITFYVQLRRKAYFQLEGTCTWVQVKLFTKSYQIVLMDAKEQEHSLRIEKNHQIRLGLSYRFYFKEPSGISSGQNPLLEKMFLTEQLLGVEQIAPIMPAASDPTTNT